MLFFRLIVQEAPQIVSPFVSCLNAHHNIEMQSVTMVAVFAQVSYYYFLS